MLVGVMEAPGNLPLIRELQRGGGTVSTEPIEHSEPTLWVSS